MNFQLIRELPRRWSAGFGYRSARLHMEEREKCDGKEEGGHKQREAEMGGWRGDWPKLKQDQANRGEHS